MYNILVFGLNETYQTLVKSFEPLPCRFIHINSASEFYSTAFSRIFDVWFIETEHHDTPEIDLPQLAAAHHIPHVFFYHKPPDSVLVERSTVIEKNDFSESCKLFSQLMRHRQEQNQEKYLAGYVQDQPGIEAIITKSPLMENLLDLVKDIAPTDSPIFLLGETGTGKELLANIIHNESRRRSGPFMAVNCGALPDSLLESELFGYEKGAFTGAGSRHIGKIEHASGGTLFLDEIESMSPAMQVRLLRVLKEKSLQRLG